MPPALVRTTLGACLAAVPVFVPTAVSPAEIWRHPAPGTETAVALPPTRYVAAQASRYVLAKATAADRPKKRNRHSHRPPSRATVSASPLVAGGLDGLAPPPPLAVTAYQAAAALVKGTASCNLSWTVLAGIGEMESHHAASGGSGAADWNGIAHPAILGPVLTGGNGSRAIPDTDNGRLDGDPTWDRAVGPMQFLPGTWAAYGVDADGDGVANPQDIRDASLAAANYLCHGRTDLGNPQQLAAAIYSYNHADWYVSDVVSLAATYQNLSTTRIGSARIVNRAIAFAYAHLGDPYLWGGTGPLYDCSGFTQAAFASAGVAIPRTAEDQWLQLPHVDDGQLRAGDLVFFNPGEFRPGLPGHVGIYLGNGYMIDDPHTGATVQVTRITGAGRYVGAARPAILGPGSMLVPTSPGGGDIDPPEQTVDTNKADKNNDKAAPGNSGHPKNDRTHDSGAGNAGSGNGKTDHDGGSGAGQGDGPSGAGSPGQGQGGSHGHDGSHGQGQGGSHSHDGSHGQGQGGSHGHDGSSTGHPDPTTPPTADPTTPPAATDPDAPGTTTTGTTTTGTTTTGTTTTGTTTTDTDDNPSATTTGTVDPTTGATVTPTSTGQTGSQQASVSSDGGTGGSTSTGLDQLRRGDAPAHATDGTALLRLRYGL